MTMHEEHRFRRTYGIALLYHSIVRIRIAALAIGMTLVSSIPTLALDLHADKVCADKVSTMDIVQCTAGQTKKWDARLNVAYAALLDFVEPIQRKPLRDAQRMWIKYRDANCAFYGAGGGTVVQIREADCQLAMTRDRTLEFESAAKP